MKTYQALPTTRSCLIGAAELINARGGFSVKFWPIGFPGPHMFRGKYLNLLACSTFCVFQYEAFTVLGAPCTYWQVKERIA